MQGKQQLLSLGKVCIELCGVLERIIECNLRETAPSQRVKLIINSTDKHLYWASDWTKSCRCQWEAYQFVCCISLVGMPLHIIGELIYLVMSFDSSIRKGSDVSSLATEYIALDGSKPLNVGLRNGHTGSITTVDQVNQLIGAMDERDIIALIALALLARSPCVVIIGSLVRACTRGERSQQRCPFGSLSGDNVLPRLFSLYGNDRHDVCYVDTLQIVR